MSKRVPPNLSKHLHYLYTEILLLKTEINSSRHNIYIWGSHMVILQALAFPAARSLKQICHPPRMLCWARASIPQQISPKGQQVNFWVGVGEASGRHTSDGVTLWRQYSSYHASVLPSTSWFSCKISPPTLHPPYTPGRSDSHGTFTFTYRHGSIHPF